MGEKGNTFEV